MLRKKLKSNQVTNDKRLLPNLVIKSSPPRQKQGRATTWVKPKGGPVIACIDMGTNSFHMIVCQATPDRDHFEVITRVKEAVPFFRQSLSNHYIDAQALRSASRILKEMIKKAKAHRTNQIVAVATSAVRESQNGAEALEHFRQELQLDAKMISGKEEARLIYLGTLWSMPSLDDNFALVDIGGGSTEVIVANRFRIFFAESYKLGAARLTERFFRKKGPSSETIKELHGEVQGVLKPAAAQAQISGFNLLIGTSGTILTLAKMDRERIKKPSAELNGYRLPLSRLENLVDEIEDASLSGQRIRGISFDRNQTLLAGAIVLLETMRSLGASETIVSTAALREGAIVDRFLQTGWLKADLEHHRDPRSSSVHSLIEKYHGSFEHAEQVARLAMEIFFKIKGFLHDYPEEIGHLLWSAAMLHDVGMFIGRNGHHRHSYYLIKHGGLLGHSEEEVNLIASIARYHRGSEPKESHEAYSHVPIKSRGLVCRLASILRIAEALDRSHRQVINTISIKIEPNQADASNRKMILAVELKPEEDCASERWALNEKRAFFEDQFMVKLELIVEKPELSQINSKREISRRA